MTWTRKGEFGSLTLRSPEMDGKPLTARVAACYSKHRRQDTQVQHQRSSGSCAIGWR